MDTMYLPATVQKNAKLPAQKIIEKILSEVGLHTQGMEPEDDRTLVIIKRIA